MKTVIISFVLLTFFACTPSLYLNKDRIENVHEYTVDMTKEQIRERLILFVNEKFVSSNAVIQNNEDGLFTGNGVVQLDKFLPLLDAELTFMVKYSDNFYKVKWIVKNVFYRREGSVSQDYWGYYEDDIVEAVDKNNEKLEAFMKDKDYNF